MSTPHFSSFRSGFDHRVPSLRRAALAVVLFGMLVVTAIAPACSSSATCVDSKCAPGNKCVDDGKGSACRLLCDGQSACPFSYHCTAGMSAKQTYCVADKVKLAKKDKGQWGARCTPTGGLDANPDCASDQGFWCYGQTPTDGAAYCTQYQCTDDSDCAGGYWCATINNEPSVRSATRTFGADKTTTVCQKREYCATCKADVDCPSVGGVKSHCVHAFASSPSFCTTECANDGNCSPDAKCTQADAGMVCTPRALTCKGDGTLCSPCRADSDCPKGFCPYQNYSHERYCSVASPTPCKRDASNKLIADCPMSNQAMARVSCSTTVSDPAIPKDQCFGVVQFGTDSATGMPSYIDGCWAVNPK